MAIFTQKISHKSWGLPVFIRSVNGPPRGGSHEPAAYAGNGTHHLTFSIRLSVGKGTIGRY